PDVLRVLTQRKLVDYLRARRGAALARGDYEIEVTEGRNAELVLPERPDGVRLSVPARNTLWGRIEFALYVASSNGKHRRVAVVGRGGTSILDDICELDEFACPPWDSDQVSGQVVFEALQQSAGRRAVLRDREAFPLFVDAIKAIEPAVGETVERLAKEVDAQTADRLSELIRRIFSKVLRELSELDNPMRAPGGPEPGDGGLLLPEANPEGGTREPPSPQAPALDALLPPADPVEANPSPARPDRAGSSHLPTLVPDPVPGEARSRFDPDDGVVYYNESHADYLLVKDSEPMLLDYLATLVAKEYVVYNNPRASSCELGEELVRMLVRVRRHLPRRVS
ncbi:MAG TPA: hypothetical protein VME46_12075, partial [Acidimicrobiales bacterium]|nr:hypothetical protein [Acidimicrobiales bacterium]